MSGSPESGPVDVEGSIERARGRMARLPDHKPFSDEGYEAFQDYIGDYIRALASESVAVTQRGGADVVSARDVDRASEYLFKGARRGLGRYFSAVGGLLLGAALGNGLNLLSVEHPSAAAVGVTVAMAIAGTFLVAFQFARDTR